MAPYENRFRLLEARCSPFAADLLRQLQHHAKLAELMDMLESIDGAIFRGDVEQALARLNKERND